MWQKMSISGKIWVGISILIAGYFVSMLYGFTNGGHTVSQLEQVSDTIFPATRESQSALTTFSEQIKLYNDAVILGDDTVVKTAKEKSVIVIKSIKAITELSSLDDEQRAENEKLLRAITKFTNEAQVVYLAMSSEDEDDEVDYFAKAQVLAKETEVLLKGLEKNSKYFTEALNGELSHLVDLTNRQRYLNLFLFFAVVSGGVVIVSFIIMKFVRQPLRDVIEMLRDIAEGEGDLTKRLGVKSKDEFGVLSKWFNMFVDNLQKMIRDIAGNAETLNMSSMELADLSGLMTEGSGQMSQKSDNVASAAGEMNDNMTSVAAAMEQASSNTGVVAAATEEMTSTINEIAQNSEKARTITDQAVSQSKSASDRVEELGQAAQDIGKVTEAITEISEQTNLLALNATIEAARAGEAGRGFAVVANEIKELARQTADATQDIKSKVDGIQNSTSGTVTDIEQISKIINEVNDIVSTIATAVEEQSVTTQEIANNVVQVSTGIQEVNENVSQSSVVSGQIAEDISEVNQAAGEMTNSSSQMSMSTEKLSDLATQLTELVEKFKV